MSAATDAAHTDSQVGPYSGLRVLVPLDETAQARGALVYAQALAQATHSELKLLRASGIEAEVGFDSLDNYAEHVRQTGVAVHSTVVKDQAAESAILEAVRSWRPDLITMATRKWSAVDRWLSGSVTDAIIKSASVPILVVPPNWERPFGRDLTSPSLPPDQPSTVVRYAPDWPQPQPPERPVRILVALDGPRAAEQALVPAIRFAHLTPVSLLLLRVIGKTGPDVDEAEDYMRRVAANVESALPGQHITSRVTLGEPVSAIL
ncbi:MAG TPA: universal stress protein, partial [Chloroflexota bacterium]